MNVSLRTQACVLLGCEHPVVLAGMGGVGRSELVAAVTQAGGFGFLGMVREPPSLIHREVEAVRRVTSKPFGANLIPAATDGDLLEQQLVTCIELGVPVVALFWTCPERSFGAFATRAFLWCVRSDPPRKENWPNEPEHKF